MELWRQIEETQQQLDVALLGLSNVGKDYAVAQQQYKTAKSQKILELRALETPMTIIKELADGDENVSLLRLKRDIAQSLWESKMEAINVKKLELRILMGRFDKEYANEK